MKMSSTNKVMLGDYMIGDTLGKGTFGKVKLGIYMPTKDKMAVKILEKSKMKDKDDYNRVVREMKIIKQFNNENVIKVYEILEDREKYYIIMEYCEEGELFNYIVKNKRLPEEEAAYFFYQIINGLESIHSLDIVHRDLKPENLLLNKEKKLKIIDFGLSNFFSIEGNLLATPCGSPCYASPEMVAGKKYKGFSIDVWSTGIILYAMICGYLPFEDPDNEKLFLKILECNLTFPGYVTRLVKDMMRKILVTDPEKRITLEEIKKHPFYLLGKAAYTKQFSSKTDPSTEGSSMKDPRSAVSSEKSETPIVKSKIIKHTHNTSVQSPSNGLNFNNFVQNFSPKELKYEVLNTVGNTSVKATKNEFFKYSDYNYQITDGKKITLTSNGNKNLNQFNKKTFSTDPPKGRTNKVKNLSLASNNPKVDDLIGVVEVRGTIGQIPFFKKNLAIETSKKLNNNSKETVSFYSLDFNAPPNTNKNSKPPKFFDFNFTKSKFLKDNIVNSSNLKHLSKKMLPSIKNEADFYRTKRSNFESRNLYVKTENSGSVDAFRTNSRNMNKRALITNLHTTKYSNNLKFDKFSGSMSNNAKLSNTFNKFKDKIVYTKDIFSNIGGVKSL